MPAPSQLAIATSVVTRLVKEEASYHKELDQQKARIAKLEANNGDEYELRQEVRLSADALVATAILTQSQKQALQETHAVFPRLKTQISQAVEKLEAQIVCVQTPSLNRLAADCPQEHAKAQEPPAEEVEKANEAVQLGKKALSEMADA